MSASPSGLFGQIEKDKGQTLIDYIGDGDYESAECLLQTEPHLLFQEGCYTHPKTEKIYSGTASKIAIDLNDIDMLLMLERVFELLPGGREVKKRQFLEAIPHRFAEQSDFDFENIAEAIKKCPYSIDLRNINTNTHIGKAFYEFRQSFLQQVKSDGFYNLYHLHKAVETYFNYYSSMTVIQSEMYTIGVIGYVELLLPNWFLQAFVQGLSNALGLMRFQNPINRPEVTYKPDYHSSGYLSTTFAYGGYRSTQMITPADNMMYYLTELLTTINKAFAEIRERADLKLPPTKSWQDLKDEQRCSCVMI